MKLKKNLLFACLAASAAYSSVSAQIIPDTTFGTNGKVTTDINTHSDVIYSIKIQNDNKIVAGGWANNGHDDDFALARYNYNGSIDLSFGNNGKVITDFQGNDDRVHAIALTGDQKILAAGSVYDSIGLSHFCINRYNANGSLDATFGNMGRVVTSVNSNSEGHGLTIQNDGKILVVGKSYAGPDGDFAIVRYTSNGTLDNSFNGTGILTLDFGEWNDIAQSVLVHPNGKIMVSGRNNGNMLVTRLNANGTVDNTFATNGKLIVNNLSALKSEMAIQPDGKILVAGNSALDIALIRLTENGVLDSTFNSTGVVSIDYGNNCLDNGSSLALQTDGKIIVTGESYINGNYSDFALLRFNANGSLDQTISMSGKITTDFSGSNDWAFSALIQNDGKILLAGQGAGAGSDFALARYMDTQLPTVAPSLSADIPNVTVFPNPFTGHITLSASDSEQLTFSLFNFSGQQILQQTLKRSATINTEQFTNGIYFYELRSDNGVVKTGKLLKR